MPTTGVMYTLKECAEKAGRSVDHLKRNWETLFPNAYRAGGGRLVLVPERDLLAYMENPPPGGWPKGKPRGKKRKSAET